MVRPEKERLVAEALTLRATGSDDWRPWWDLAVYNAACESLYLTSDYVWRLVLNRKAPIPDEHRNMGPLMQAARRSGWIEAPDVRHLIAEPVTHRHSGRGQRIWTSLIFGRTPAVWPEKE